MTTEAELEKLLPLLGDEALVLRHRQADGAEGDVDVAVAGLDRSFGLRLSDGWRLCQFLHQDVRSWFYVLERHG